MSLQKKTDGQSLLQRQEEVDGADRIDDDIMDATDTTVQHAEGSRDDIVRPKPITATMTPLVQRIEDFAESQGLENVHEERGTWGPIHKKFGMSLNAYATYVLVNRKEPGLSVKSHSVIDSEKTKKERKKKSVERRKARREQRVWASRNWEPTVQQKQVHRWREPDSPPVQLSLTTGGSPLPASEQVFFGPRFDWDLGGVRVHNGASTALQAERNDTQPLTSGCHMGQAIQRLAIWNMPAHFAASQPGLVGPLAAAANSNARFDTYIRGRTPILFAGDWDAHKRSLAGKFRRPAGRHEWAPVKEAVHMQENWFHNHLLTYADYQGLRTRTRNTKFATRINPNAQIHHGGTGSPAAHDELFDLVTSNDDWDDFRDDLDAWATDTDNTNYDYRAHAGTVHNPPGRGW